MLAAWRIELRLHNHHIVLKMFLQEFDRLFAGVGLRVGQVCHLKISSNFSNEFPATQHLGLPMQKNQPWAPWTISFPFLHCGQSIEMSPDEAST
jgi:hypothetical protein